MRRVHSGQGSPGPALTIGSLCAVLLLIAIHQSRAHGIQRASLLLNHSKAADVDVETVYRLAVSGLDELCDADEALAPFREVRSRALSGPGIEAIRI